MRARGRERSPHPRPPERDATRLPKRARDLVTDAAEGRAGDAALAGGVGPWPGIRAQGARRAQVSEGGKARSARPWEGTGALTSARPAASSPAFPLSLAAVLLGWCKLIWDPEAPAQSSSYQLCGRNLATSAGRS